MWKRDKILLQEIIFSHTSELSFFLFFPSQVDKCKDFSCQQRIDKILKTSKLQLIPIVIHFFVLSILKSSTQIFSTGVFEDIYTMHFLWCDSQTMKMWIIYRDLALFVMLYATAPALASLFLIPTLLPLLNLSFHFAVNACIHGSNCLFWSIDTHLHIKSQQLIKWNSR